jgi:hypothetical protein
MSTQVELWYIDGCECPDSPWLVGTYTTMKAAEGARTQMIRQMTNPAIPYRFEFKEFHLREKFADKRQKHSF